MELHLWVLYFSATQRRRYYRKMKTEETQCKHVCLVRAAATSGGSMIF